MVKGEACWQERLRKRPRLPPGLSADEKAKNREIVKRMQVKAGPAGFLSKKGLSKGFRRLLTASSD